jgi:hypothetical protein
MQATANAVETAETPINWSSDAPRGGRLVLNRILKENAQVPLFFAQTLIASLRDVGYSHTTSALCEHVDNAIEAGATEIRIFFRQTGKKGDYQIDAAVYDNGRGMEANVLKVATSFGGSMNYNNRDGWQVHRLEQLVLWGLRWLSRYRPDIDQGGLASS